MRAGCFQKYQGRIFAPPSSACALHWSRFMISCHPAALQLESMEGELNSTHSTAQQQIAQARKDAASAVSAARQAAAEGGAQSLAHAAEREAALQRQAAELRAELDVSCVRNCCSSLACKSQRRLKG